jgi:hypothetical protein
MEEDTSKNPNKKKDLATKLTRLVLERISPTLQYMELQHPMTCFLGQKATLIAKMFHLLAALPSFNKTRAHKEWPNPINISVKQNWKSQPE